MDVDTEDAWSDCDKIVIRYPTPFGKHIGSAVKRVLGQLHPVLDADAFVLQFVADLVIQIVHQLIETAKQMHCCCTCDDDGDDQEDKGQDKDSLHDLCLERLENATKRVLGSRVADLGPEVELCKHACSEGHKAARTATDHVTVKSLKWQVGSNFQSLDALLAPHLVFPAVHTYYWILECHRCSLTAEATYFVTGVMEYLGAEIMDVAARWKKQRGSGCPNQVTLNHVVSGIKDDWELDTVFHKLMFRDLRLAIHFLPLPNPLLDIIVGYY